MIDRLTLEGRQPELSDPETRIDRAVASALDAERARHQVANARRKALKSMQKNAVALDELSRRLCSLSIAEARAADELLERTITGANRQDERGAPAGRRTREASSLWVRTWRTIVTIAAAAALGIAFLAVIEALAAGW